MEGLFVSGKEQAPLAERMRPRSLKEFVGQQHLLGPGKVLRCMIESGQVRSLILWGPPGTGKTTLGMIIARACSAEFVHFSATRSGIKAVQQAMERSRRKFKAYRQRDLIFVDELHRFNKAQQAAFLPYVEEGSVILIGATTENPSFEVINSLLSRSQVFTLRPLSTTEIKLILSHTLAEPQRGLGDKLLQLSPEAQEFITESCDGDARRALNLLELAADLASGARITLDTVQEAFQRKAPQYDKSGEEHYNLISALHKSVRNSDPDAALYWLARMLASGEDPLYLARRLIRMAVEDIGLADPQALPLAIAAKEAYAFLGAPEGELALAQITVYLATAPKSNSIYTAFRAAQSDVNKTRNQPVPLPLRNAPTRLMKELGYGQGYRYAHDDARGVTELECLPENLRGQRYYRPGGRGFEAQIQERLERWSKLLAKPTDPTGK